MAVIDNKVTIIGCGPGGREYIPAAAASAV